MSAASGSEPAIARGRVEAAVAAEFPGLELRWCAAEGSPRRSPPAVRERLRALSDRYLGARVVAMRTQPIAHAYRAFFRHTGLDPDVTRVPSEAAAVQRLRQGGFLSRDLISDARLIALVETGVPVWALDATRADGVTLGIRSSTVGEPVCVSASGAPQAVSAGRLVVSDAQCALGLLFGEIPEPCAPGDRTDSLVLFTVGVDGVPAIFLDEALWLCAEVLTG
jgi:DNA/RNA-binding domain of Phe-tRNA-synthetase-like protein